MIYLEPSCLDHTFSPLPQEKPNESRMERRPGTEYCKGIIGRLLRDEEQGSNPDQRAQALLCFRATPFSAPRSWRKVRSHRGDAESHRRAYPGARSARRCPDG